MQTKWLMGFSAFFMAIVGLLCAFLPQEIVEWFGYSSASVLLLAVQMIGGLYLGFAILNWFSKSSRIGGIYSRPIVLGNLMHFIVVSFAMMRQLNFEPSFFLVIITLIYSLFAIWFSLVLSFNPLIQQTKTISKQK